MPSSLCDQIPVGTKDVRVNLLVRECNAAGVLVGVDLALATGFQVWLESPSAVVKTRTGDLTTDGTDFLFGYTLAAGDIDEAGTWKVQGCFELPVGTGPFPTDVTTFVAFLGLKGLNIVSPGLVVLDLIGPRVTAVLA